jgi:hypothetical protein
MRPSGYRGKLEEMEAPRAEFDLEARREHWISVALEGRT